MTNLLNAKVNVKELFGDFFDKSSRNGIIVDFSPAGWSPEKYIILFDNGRIESHLLGFIKIISLPEQKND